MLPVLRVLLHRFQTYKYQQPQACLWRNKYRRHGKGDGHASWLGRWRVEGDVLMCVECFWFKHSLFKTHRIHGNGIFYLRSVDFLLVDVGKYNSHPMGNGGCFGVFWRTFHWKGLRMHNNFWYFFLGGFFQLAMWIDHTQPPSYLVKLM